MVMKINEMRAMSILEARKEISDLRTELAKERAIAAGGTRPENPGRIRGIKKKVARLLTIINEKLRAGEKEEIPEEKGAKEAPAKETPVKKEVKKTAKKKKKAVRKKKMKKSKKKKTPIKKGKKSSKKEKKAKKVKGKKKSKKEVKKS